jgi:hypothetical protein
MRPVDDEKQKSLINQQDQASLATTGSKFYKKQPLWTPDNLMQYGDQDSGHDIKPMYKNKDIHHSVYEDFYTLKNKRNEIKALLSTSNKKDKFVVNSFK